ncbi:hypothetical protein HUU59_00105 [bacterium]|nr:hypothetical protein [bacterium]
MLRASRSAFLFLSLLCALSPLFAQSAANGVSWGFTRTYWDGTWYRDGYAQAGTGGNMISVRRDLPMNNQTRIAILGSYSWLRHTTTTLREPVVIDPVTDEVISGGLLTTRTDKTYFREIELAAHLHHYVDSEGRSQFYLGGGPSARWGSAGKREQNSRKSEFHTNAAWFGLSALVGMKQQWSDGALTTFFEPRLLWSPDPSDRFQETFPPVNLIVAMGVLW